MNWKKISIIRSHRRKKTIEAKIKDDVLCIYLPTTLDATEEQKIITEMKNKIQEKQKRKHLHTDTLLQKRSEYLNHKYFKNRLTYAISFSQNQKKTYGICNARQQRIRISERIQEMPRFVQDYLIMHELTHLLHPNHSQVFWETMNRYPHVERAKGFLQGYEYFRKRQRKNKEK
jgi:predicted metal-dependent hydrolase